MTNRIVLALCSAVFFLTACGPSTQEFYVSNNGNDTAEASQEQPLKTIEEALNRIRKEKHEGQTIVYVAAGEYRLNTPLLFSKELSNVTIQGAGQGQTVIKGSREMKLNWQQKGNIWEAKVQDGVQFDQLYVNGKQQILARYPNYDENGGHWQGHAPDAISPERVKSWKNPKGGYLHVMHRGEWGGFHYEIAGVDDQGELELTGGYQNNRPSTMHPTYRMVENVLEELDSPGEWYLSEENNRLYYWPPAGVNPATAVVEGAYLKHLIEIKGTEQNPTHQVTISGLTLTHTRRTFTEEYEPLLRSDWTIYRGGAVFVEGATQVLIDDCEFTNLGGNAVFVSSFSRDITISNNHMYEIGASAISFVGSPEAVRSPSFQYGEFVPLEEMDTVRGPKNNLYPANSTADNNLIYKIGRVEKQVAGVQISMAMDIKVSRNSIYDVPRAGINVSEGTWGGHIIEYNDVFKTVQESGDHGSFNSWGRDRFWHPNRGRMNEIVRENPDMPRWDAIHTTLIRNNRFRCDHGWDIDLDDGSSNYEIYNNLCLNGGIKLREGFYRVVENNIMVNNGFHPHVWFENSGDVFRKNIMGTGHKDIRLAAWGKEVDANLFPDKEALAQAQQKGVDKNSSYGDPLFVDPKNGDFTVKEGSPALALGFQNFSMDQFGVQNPNLKAIAKTPEIPVLWAALEKDGDTKQVNWLGATIKNIETMAERSASGLSKTAGVLIVGIDEKSIIAKSALQEGDVIISCEGDVVDDIPQLLKSHQANNWRGHLSLEIFRNQKSMNVEMSTK